MKKSIFIFLTVVLAFCASPLLGSIYDAAADFSLLSNPNGVWTYGWRTELLSTHLTTYELSGTYDGGIDYWFTGSYSNGLPDVGHNGTSQQIGNPDWVVWAPGALSLHPEYRSLIHHPDPIVPAFSIVRFTAPESITYTLAAAFTGIAPSPSADVHVILNGVSIFDGLVNGRGDGCSFTSPVSLAQGDTLDFVVGNGGSQPIWDNGDNDTVQLKATIIPEPATLLLLGLGGLALLRRRRTL